MIPDRLQRQRYELKFQIAEATALGLRDFVRADLEPDEFAVGARGFSHPVHRLYLDSAELGQYRATSKGGPNRFKPRVRYSGEAAESSVFFEIERRLDDCIRRDRASVPLLGTGAPDPGLRIHIFPPSDVVLSQGERVDVVLAPAGE